MTLKNCDTRQFYSDPRDILYEKGTDNFCDLMGHKCEKPSTENFVFESSMAVSTYDAVLIVEERSYIMVHNFFLQIHIFTFVNIIPKTYTNYVLTKKSVHFLCMSSLCTRGKINMKRLVLKMTRLVKFIQ